jgi:diaminopimelate epimerase
MRLHFTKMHGAGNDFVVLDATRAPLALSREQLQFLGDRRFGVGADQILVVEAAQTPAWTSATASSTAPPATRWSSAATARAASCAMCTTTA